MFQQKKAIAPFFCRPFFCLWERNQDRVSIDWARRFVRPGDGCSPRFATPPRPAGPRVSTYAPSPSTVKDFPICHSADYPCFLRCLQETCYRGWHENRRAGFRPRGKLGCGFPQVLGVSWLLKVLSGACPSPCPLPPELEGECGAIHRRDHEAFRGRGMRKLSDFQKQPDDAYLGDELQSNPQSKI